MSKPVTFTYLVTLEFDEYTDALAQAKTSIRDEILSNLEDVYRDASRILVNRFPDYRRAVASEDIV